jgi:hypothetical protein
MLSSLLAVADIRELQIIRYIQAHIQLVLIYNIHKHPRDEEEKVNLRTGIGNFIY